MEYESRQQPDLRLLREKKKRNRREVNLFLCVSAGERLLGVIGLSPLHAEACVKKKKYMDKRPVLLFGCDTRVPFFPSHDGGLMGARETV